MRFHVVSLPHTQTTKEYLPCAYTQKVVNFCRMMRSLGHEIFLYASEDNDAPCTELITCVSKEVQRETLEANDWKKEFFKISWDANLPYWKIMNANAIAGIKARIQERDFICLIGGSCQGPIADAFPGYQVVEFGIGYKGVLGGARRDNHHMVFESYAWMHHVYGLNRIEHGKNYDAVIPNYFDPADFPFSAEKDNYFLFVGRLISSKGADIAAEVCKRMGVKLVLAGQGCKAQEPGKWVEGDGFRIEGNVEHVGTVDVAARGKLMSRARALFVQTQYIGPFEGVHVEAMMCGTPVITTDWGVFTETVADGVQGFRTRSVGEAVWAAKEAGRLDYAAIRDYAVGRFSLNSVRHLYQDYFRNLLTLWEDGFYTNSYDPMDKRILGSFV